MKRAVLVRLESRHCPSQGTREDLRDGLLGGCCGIHLQSGQLQGLPGCEIRTHEVLGLGTGPQTEIAAIGAISTVISAVGNPERDTVVPSGDVFHFRALLELRQQEARSLVHFVQLGRDLFLLHGDDIRVRRHR